MKDLLFLAHRPPYPPNKGEKIRAWHILGHLARTHRVHLGCLADTPEDFAQQGELERLCASIGRFQIDPKLQKARALLGLRRNRALTIDCFYNRELMRWVKETILRHKIKDVFIFSSAMANYVLEDQALFRILDMVDVDSEKWRAYACKTRWPLRTLYSREASTLLRFERQLVAEFDHTLFVSEAEAQRFVQLAPECQERVGWIENGVDLKAFSFESKWPSPFREEGRHIVFTGTMDYWPNMDAVSYFAESVLPLIRRVQPAIKFHIVGANPSPSVSRLAHIPGVSVTGSVPDVRPYLANADVVVAPLRIARGIQNKVLEAMAMARPVVLTSEALEGIHAVAGRDLVVGDSPEAMANLSLEILAGGYSGLGRSARTAVERHHCWAHTLRKLDLLFPADPGDQSVADARFAQRILSTA